MAENVRNLDMGLSADPRSEWARLQPLHEFPVAYRVMSDGEPKLVHVLGYTDTQVVIAWPPTDASLSKPDYVKWHVTNVAPEDVHPTVEIARLYGLANIQTKLTDLAKALEKAAAATGALLKKK